MDDRQLIEDLLSALEYHIEQTRPIQFSTVAIEAAREHLRKPAQQEPVAKICHDLDGHIGWNPNLRQLPDEGVALYTSPPAQRTWVGLTDEEIQKEFHPLHATGLQFARAIEAKLKEKNGA